MSQELIEAGKARNEFDTKFKALFVVEFNKLIKE